MAASMGAVYFVLARQEKRSVLHSRVMIHQPSGGAQGVATDMEINCEMLKLKDEFIQIISNHSGRQSS
jgi:ATP-dependent Clp protease protease subunit